MKFGAAQATRPARELRSLREGVTLAQFQRVPVQLRIRRLEDVQRD